jgi:hypothetical protein
MTFCEQCPQFSVQNKVGDNCLCTGELAGQSPPCVHNADLEQTLEKGAVITLSVIMLILLITLLGVIRFWRNRIIYSASPIFCIIFLVGCGMVVMAGYATAGSPTQVRCLGKIWWFNIGFSLAIGSMFIKSLRLHRIFNNPRATALAIKNSLLFKQLAVLCLFDVILLSVVSGGGHYGLNSDVTKARMCVSNSKSGKALFVLLMVSKTALLTGSAWLAYKIRFLPSIFNESRHIRMIVNVGISMATVWFVVVYSLGTEVRPASRNLIDVMLMAVGPLMNVIGMFGPKFWAIYKGDDTQDGIKRAQSVINSPEFRKSHNLGATVNPNLTLGSSSRHVKNLSTIHSETGGDDSLEAGLGGVGDDDENGRGSGTAQAREEMARLQVELEVSEAKISKVEFNINRVQKSMETYKAELAAHYAVVSSLTSDLDFLANLTEERNVHKFKSDKTRTKSFFVRASSRQSSSKVSLKQPKSIELHKMNSLAHKKGSSSTGSHISLLKKYGGVLPDLGEELSMSTTGGRTSDSSNSNSSGSTRKLHSSSDSNSSVAEAEAAGVAYQAPAGSYRPPITNNPIVNHAAAARVDLIMPMVDADAGPSSLSSQTSLRSSNAEKSSAGNAVTEDVQPSSGE